MSENKAEIFFYHLVAAPLERVLPDLLEKTLLKGWRATVQAGSGERVEALDQLLWTYADATFLPHGTDADGSAADQPVLLTAAPGNPNGSHVRFFVDGADSDDLSGLARVVYLFDGNDETAVASARKRWKSARADGHDVTYWYEDEQGKWQRKEGA